MKATKSLVTNGLVLGLLSLASGLTPAFAETTLQGFECDQRGSVTFQGPTSHDKKFVIPSINKVAVLVDASAQGPVGISYDVNPPQPFQFITWYYKEAAGSQALKGVTVRYCVQKKDGSDVTSFDIQGGNGDRGGPVGDGWSDVVQDTRATFPHFVIAGNGVLTKLTFIFKDKNSANNITLGKVVISPGSLTPHLRTALGPCSLKEKCTEPK